jgi:hypothetical protein
MAKDIHELHTLVNAKPNYSATKNVNANSITVSKNGIVVHPRVVHESTTDHVIIGDGSGVAVGDTTRWLATLK